MDALRIPKAAARNRDSILKYGIQQRLPYRLEDVYLGLTHIHEDEQSQCVLFSAIKRLLALSLIAILKKQGIRLAGFLPTSLLDYYSSRYILGEEHWVIIKTAMHDTLITVNHEAGFYVRKGVNPVQSIDHESKYLKIRNQFKKHTEHLLPNKVYRISDDANNTLDLSSNERVSLKNAPSLNNRNTIISKLIGVAVLTKENDFTQLRPSGFLSKSSYNKAAILTATILLVSILSIQLVIHSNYKSALDRKDKMDMLINELQDKERAFAQQALEIENLSQARQEWEYLLDKKRTGIHS